jgi:putative membrane protein
MNEENSKQPLKKIPGKTSSPEPAATSGSGAGVRKEIRKVFTGLESALGFGQGKAEEHKVETGDVSTHLAEKRTDLALERNYLATERTLMGWIRTSLSMISFGFTIGKLGQVLNSVNTKGIFGAGRTVSVDSIAYFLVILGTAALLGAALQHRHRVKELFRMGLHPQFSITFTVSLLLTAVGAFAFTSLVMAL